MEGEGEVLETHEGSVSVERASALVWAPGWRNPAPL